MKKLVLLCAGAVLGCFSMAHGAVVDLTTKGSSAVISTNYGSVIFTTEFQTTTGTGTFNPFLSIQGANTEQGYNTSASSGVFDTKRAGQYTRNLQVKDLATVTINGATYYSFLIDINEPNSGGQTQISLDALKIYTSTTGSQTTTDIDSLGTKRFDLDLPADSYVLYDDAIGGNGSGSGDIAFFIPTSAFIGASPTDYVYMYQYWGGYSSSGFNGSAQSGFEETAVGYGVVPVPEFSSVLPLGLVLGSVVGVRRFRRRREGEID